MVEAAQDAEPRAAVRDAPAFLTGGGEMGARMRTHDWAATPLGAPATWPQSLRTMVSACLNSPILGTILWGPDLRMLYNDAYIPSMADRHPAALGRPVAEVWGAAWAQVAAPFHRAMRTGEGFSQEKIALPIVRHGRVETTWWTFSAAPIRGEKGEIVGLLNQGFEITARVAEERRAAREAARQRLIFQQMPGFVGVLRGPDHVYEYVNEAYETIAGRRAFVGRGVREVFPELAGQGFFELLDEVYRTGEPFAARAMPIRLAGESADRAIDLLYQPIRDEAGTVTGVFVGGYDITERVRAERALRDSEEQLRIALAAADLGTWTLDLTTDTSVRSARHDEIFGYSEPQPTWGRAVAERHVLEEDREAFRKAFARALETSLLSFETRVRCPNGAIRWIAVQGRTTYGEDGRPVRIAGVVADVSDRRQAETALSDSEERYRTLFDSLDEGFCIIEFFDGPHGPLSDYVHVEANAAYARHTGIPNVVGQKLREMVPDEADGWVELYGGVLASGQSIRFERELLATKRHLELAAFRIEPASRRQVAVVFQDITARKRAEAALQRLNETLEARVVEALAERKLMADIVEGTNAFVQVVDLQSRWLAINGAAAREFERIFGVRPKVGDCMLDLLADQPGHREALRAMWARALAGEEFVEIAAFGDPKRGLTHHEMRFNALRDADGAVIGAYQFVYDVTERLAEQERLRATEDALRQSQKMEAVGQLTGGLAHDFNNLLAGISGSLELMQIRMSQGRLKDVERYVTAAQGAARRAAALTHRLLAFSRRQTLAPKPTDVNRLVAGMEELIRRTVGPAITIETVGSTGLWPALIDPPQLENALLNLCINARDAMPDGGRITIETANKWMDARAARQHDMPPGQYLSLCVTDTGTGMAPEVIDKVFEPFFTTKPIGEGTGLGLSMIYGFVQQSGGQVRIYSEVGHGTTVCLYLPRHYGESEAEDDAGQAERAERADEGQTVLIVDDEPTVRMLVTDVLEELGYTAIEAADSASGLKVLQSNVRIDLLVTDVGLPGGMNGRQMADAGRVSRPDLKVLFITGYAENAVLGHGHLEPGMQVMTKPFVMDVLAARIKELIVP